jgi:flagellar basal-body rod protein FlgB
VGRTDDWEVWVSIFAADGVSGVLANALDGITARQNVIADNIANVDTPGFRASTLDFETSLRAAVARGDGTAPLSFQTLATDTPVGVNGNNVDLRKETMAAMQSSFQYQLVTRSAADRLADLRTAVERF